MHGTDHWRGDFKVEQARGAWAAVTERARQLVREGLADSLELGRADAMMELILEHSDVKVVVHATRAANVDGDAATATDGQTTTESGRGADAAPAAAAPAKAPTTRRRASASPGAADTRQRAQTLAAAAAHTEASGVEDLVEVGGLGGPGTTFVPREWLDGTGTADPERDLACDTDTGALLTGDVPLSLTRGQDAARRAHRARERAKEKAEAASDTRTTDTEASAVADGGEADVDVVDFSESYRVPDPMARLVRLRDGACRFPGCAVTAHQCDLDHVKPWPAGPTSPTNLMALCRRHHRIKQRDGWTARLHPDATVTWTDPTGLSTTTWPVDHLHLITAGATRRDPARTSGGLIGTEIPTSFEEALIELLGGPANAAPRDYPVSFDIEGNTYGGPPPRIDIEHQPWWSRFSVEITPPPPPAVEAIPF